MKAATKQWLIGAGTMALITASNAAMAAGVDTGSSSLGALKQWMMTWIPIAATILIIITAIMWMSHVMHHNFAIRIVGGLIVIGSASYLVGLFGLS